MSRVLPILFNTDMVRAILDGRKTVTRRLVKLPKHIEQQENGLYTLFAEGACYENQQMDQVIDYLNKPYKPGDILYVRETWCWEPCWDCGMDTEEHNCCDESAHKIYNHNKKEWGCYGYKASLGDNVYPSVDVWHPSIHMPKEAARIWLKVTDVRVERLQEITAKEAWREGARCSCMSPIPDCAGNKTEFIKIWNSTIKKSDFERCGWDANPWVWVIEFERCEKPESEG